MRSRSIGVLLLLACVALMVSTAGPGLVMALQGEGEVIQCHSYSQDRTMSLEFPASGGEVQGSYVSDYTVQDTSLLYDEDGSSDYYAEERRVSINIQLSGSYAGNDTSFFSLQVAGSGAVDIDNLDDDRFDRSYRAVLDATATADRNEDGSITVRGMTAGFTPVARNANEIPNTRWLEAPSTPIPPELTLTCTGWPELPSESSGPRGISHPLGPPQPNGPPQPPGPRQPVAPQSRPSIPPAPPPVPAPMGECGSVQVVYLDDLGIAPNPVEIDAFIENALAQGGQDYSLVISHRQRLLDRFGPLAFQQIDTMLSQLGSIAETCPFVLIVGDPDVVPFAALPNPTNDGDVLFTDDVYGDNDHDNLTMPDIPVARIPDGRSLALLLIQLSPSSVPEGGNFTLANSKRPHADGVATQVFGTDRTLFWSLPARREHLDSSLVDVRHSYFMLHGGAWDTAVWWGEEDVYPEAFTVAEADSRGVILSGSCYGTYTYSRTPVDSITLSFLRSGARAFVGATGITYSPLWTPGPDPTGPMRYDAVFHHAFLHALSRGEAPLAAFMQAKEQMADLCESGDATAPEIKMLHEFVYFGKP